MSTTPSGPTRAGLRILVVDDVPSARRITIKLLRKVGFDTFVEAKDGREALTVLAQSPTNLVICDWQMPDMEGIELLEHMRNDPRYKGIPFIMISSTVERDSVVTALKSGASDYIIKPFNSETLSQKVEAVLANQNEP